MKSNFNFFRYFLIIIFFFSLGMFVKDFIYFILMFYKTGSSLNYISIIISGAILYKLDLIISAVCGGFLIIENYLKTKTLKGGIENAKEKV